MINILRNFIDRNPFDRDDVAEKWISSVENDKSGSREKEIYPLLYEWTEKLSPKVVVEIGSGQGVCSSKIHLGEGQYIGVEPSAPLIKRAEELYGGEQRRFIQGSAYDTSLLDGEADAVFSVGVWFHVRNLDSTSRELGRILKRGGEFIIITGDGDAADIWESFFLDYKREGKVIRGSVSVPGGELPENIMYMHTEEEIIDSLERNGLIIEETKKFGYGNTRTRPNEPIWVMIKGRK